MAANSSRKPQIAVEPRPDGRWAVQKDGTLRASRVLDRKTDAVDRAGPRLVAKVPSS